MRHGEVSRGMFPNYAISAITNGVHALTWTSPAFCELFDQYIPGWRTDNNYLRYAISIPLDDIREAHNKVESGAVSRRSGSAPAITLDPKVYTWDSRAALPPTSAANLLFHDMERLKRIARDVGPIQLIYGGKAHPRDDGGKSIIRQVFEGAQSASDVIRTVYVENYDMYWGRLITSGVDVWLNKPMRPQEASGTSGMKAAMNGVPSFSVVDGWWAEGLIEGITGWAIGNTEIDEDPVSGSGDALRQAGAGDPADVLRPAATLYRSDAVGDRAEWIVLQHPAHGAAVHGECLHAAGSRLRRRRGPSKRCRR